MPGWVVRTFRTTAAPATFPFRITSRTYLPLLARTIKQSLPPFSKNPRTAYQR